MKHSEPCTYSPEPVADCLPTSSSAISQLSLLSGMHGDVPVCASAPPMDGSRNCTLTTSTSAHLTLEDGPEKWIACMRGFLARAGLAPDVHAAIRPTIGPRPCASWGNAAQDMFFSSQFPPSPENTRDSRAICALSVTRLATTSSPTPPLWALRILGADIGPLATPTRTANQCSKSMRKHPGCRRLQTVADGKLTPQLYEWMMGWPINWTRASGCKHAATAKSRSKPQPLGESLVDRDVEVI